MKKNKISKQLLFWCLLCILIYLPAIFLGNSFLLKQISVVGIVAIATKLYFKITYKKSFMLAFLFQSLVLAADYVTIVFNNSIQKEEILQNQTTQPFLILLTKMVLFLLVVMIKNKLSSSPLEVLEDATWLKFLFFPVFTICIIIALISKPELMVNENQEHIFWGFALGLVAMNLMLYYLLQDVAKSQRELQERRMFEREIDHKFSFYESMAESTKKQQALSHEYKNQLVCIGSLLHSGQYQKLEEYVEKITGVVHKELDFIDTNHVIVNAILNEKYAKALEEGIVMVYKINDLAGVTFEDQDIALLLSNLLNNAMEACVKCMEEKVIQVKLILEDDNLVLSVKNTYNGHIVTSGEVYITTKKNKQDHGIGIKNSICVIEKYDGYYSISHNEKYFTFSCVLPIQSCP